MKIWNNRYTTGNSKTRTLNNRSTTENNNIRTWNNRYNWKLGYKIKEIKDTQLQITDQNLK